MGKELTDRQKRAVNAEGSVIVYAAAGSGKTAVLTERVIRILTDEEHPVDADRLLTVTFTNAAAAEMRGRISEALAAYADSHPSAYIERQQMLLSAAPICTIDSFCINLVRENFERAGVNPDFASATEARVIPIRDAVIRDMVTERRASGDGDFALLADCLNIDSSLGAFTSAVSSLYSSSRSLPFPEEWLRSSAEKYGGEDFGLGYWRQRIYDIALSRIEAVVSRVDTGEAYFREFPEAHLIVGGLIGAFSAGVAVLEQKIREGGWDEAAEISAALKLEAAGSRLGKAGRLYLDRYNELRGDVNAKMGKIAELFSQSSAEAKRILALEARAVRALTDFVIEYGDRLRSELIKKNILTFDMTEHMALDLVCRRNADGTVEPTDIGEALSKRYAGVLVDEYQDNNSLQDTLFHAVSDGGKKLFCVGDAKQSIYGFRHADPGIFVRYRDEYEEYVEGGKNGGKVVLDTNFRSRRGICEFTDLLFSAVMRSEAAGMDYTEDDRMTAGLPYAETDEPSVEYHRVVFDKENTKAAEAEARHIVGYIKEMLAREPFLGAVDGAEPRRAEYRDFTILMRSVKSSKGGVLIKEFRKAGIPLRFESDTIFGTTEVGVMMSLLRAIENPSDGISLMAAATGPVFGISYDEIASAKVKYPSRTLFGSLLLAAEDNGGSIARFTSEIKDLTRRSVSSTVSALCEYIYDKYSVREIMSSADEGERRAEGLDAFLALTREYEEGESSSLSGFLRFAEAAASSSGGSVSGGGSGNAVSLMTIHKSKGLQFPVCILAGCSSQFDRRDERDNVRMKAGEGISVNITDRFERKKYCPLSARVLSDSINRDMTAEEERLLYVAITRASEKAVFVISERDGKPETELGTEELRDGKLGTETIRSAACYADWLMAAAALTPISGECVGFSEGGYKKDDFGKDNPGENATGKGSSVERGFCNGCSDGSRSDEGRSGENVEPSAAVSCERHGCFVIKKYIDSVPEESVDEGPEVFPEADEAAAAELAERFAFGYPYGVPALSKTTVSKILAAEHSENDFSRRPAVCSEGGLTPAEKGTAMHRFMQYADFTAATEDIEEEIARLEEWEYLSEAEAESLDRGALKSFFRSGLCERIKNAPLVLREQDFLVPLEDSDTLIQGSVDCVFGDGEGVYIIDFKTTRADSAEQLIELYRPQLHIYASAVAEITGLPVLGKYIYSFRLGSAVEVV